MTPTIYYSQDMLIDWTKQKLGAILDNARKAKRSMSSAQHRGDDVGRVPSFDGIREGCSWAEEMSSNPNMPEPDWKGLADILAHCQDGERIFHEISSLDPRYDEAEAAAKFALAKENAKPRTCADICNSLGHTGCAGCVFRDNEHMSSPIKLGYLDPDVARLLRNHILETDTNRYLELFSGQYISEKSFNNAHRHLIRNGTPHNVVSSHPLVKKVAETVYRPGDFRRFLELENSRFAVNSWTPPDIVPRAGDAVAIMAHLEMMLPDETVRNHFLDCLAFMVQQPGQKIGLASEKWRGIFRSSGQSLELCGA